MENVWPKKDLETYLMSNKSKIFGRAKTYDNKVRHLTTDMKLYSASRLSR